MPLCAFLDAVFAFFLSRPNFARALRLSGSSGPRVRAVNTAQDNRLGTATDDGAAARAVLGQVFGYDHFRGQQAAIVEHVCGGGDALVLMPTGGGKSLCYQVPAIVRQQAG